MFVLSSPALPLPVGVVGFTGTREGMTDEQKKTLKQYIEFCAALHHGDCIGADASAHEIAQLKGVDTCVHPPENEALRAFCKGAKFVYAPKPYAVRNADIVNAAPRLIACPKGYAEEKKSGTWQTIRMARKQYKRIIIIWPNGATTEETPI